MEADFLNLSSSLAEPDAIDSTHEQGMYVAVWTVNDRDEIEWHEGMTIRQVLDIIAYDFPYFIVAVDKKIVHSGEWDTYRVPDGAVVDVHAIVPGG